MSTIYPPLDVSTLPYARRQLVLVLPDQVVEAAREAEAKAAAKAGDTDWAEVGARVAKAILSMTSIYGAAISLASDAVAAWAKARESGLDILQIGHSEAAALKFPPGHPRERMMYVAHPAMPPVYYTAATFHRMAFEHKFSEAIRLLMGIGATSIVVEHVHGWSREFSANVSAGLPGSSAKGSAGATSSGASNMLFEAQLKNKKVPALPSDLVWYDHEPTWQALAAGRLEYGMQQFSLNVVYEDDFGVNAGLKLRAQKSGLELGGSFEDHKATTWKIRGEFSSG